MKKIIICFGFICCITIVSLCIFFENQNSITQVASAKDSESSTQITFEQAVINRTISDKITQEQAMNIMISEREIILDDLSNKKYMENGLDSTDKKKAIDEIKSELLKNDTVQYYEYSKIQGFSENSIFKAAVNATIVIANDKNNKTIMGISGNTWSQKEAGFSICDWTEGNTWNEVAYDYKSVVMGAAGYFEAEIDGSKLSKIPGLSILGNVSTPLIYQSDTMNIQGTYTVD